MNMNEFGLIVLGLIFRITIATLLTFLICNYIFTPLFNLSEFSLLQSLVLTIVLEILSTWYSK